MLAAGLLAGCGSEPEETPAPKGVDEYFPIKVGDRVVRMQLAVRGEEMAKGLMHRRALGRDDGMIFVFPRPQQLSFYMRNTLVPLDIGYFSPDGELKEIYAMHARDERSTVSRGRHLQFALEMNQGWYRENGVAPGAKLDLAALAAALKARGFDPRAAGLR